MRQTVSREASTVTSLSIVFDGRSRLALASTASASRATAPAKANATTLRTTALRTVSGAPAGHARPPRSLGLRHEAASERPVAEAVCGGQHRPDRVQLETCKRRGEDGHVGLLPGFVAETALVLGLAEPKVENVGGRIGAEV